MPLPHHPNEEAISSWPTFTPDHPLRVLSSACLAGRPCGVDGTTNGVYPLAQRFFMLPNVRVFPFCPEEAAFGTPRATPDIEGGSGFDVLDGRARFVSDRGDDWTAGIVAAAHEMLRIARAHDVHLALMMDMSGACGSTVVYDGARSLKKYQRGPGVAAALLMREGIPVVSQRDERTLALLFRKLGGEAAPLADGLDHHERDWYRSHFGER